MEIALKQLIKEKLENTRNLFQKVKALFIRI